MYLVREGGLTCQILRGVQREIGERMRGGVQHFRIARKDSGEHRQKFQRVVRSIVGHGAVQAIEPQPLLKITIYGLTDRLSQQWQCLDAVTTLREIHCSIRLRPGSLRSWFGEGLRKSDSGANQETRIQERKGKGTQQSWGNDAH